MIYKHNCKFHWIDHFRELKMSNDECELPDLTDEPRRKRSNSRYGMIFDNLK